MCFHHVRVNMLSERGCDQICWLVMDYREHFYPPDETAEECIDEVIDDDNEHGVGKEHGYHAGMFIAHDELAHQIRCLGIDVLARAERYVEASVRDGQDNDTGDFTPLTETAGRRESIYEEIVRDPGDREGSYSPKARTIEMEAIDPSDPPYEAR